MSKGQSVGACCGDGLRALVVQCLSAAAESRRDEWQSRVELSGCEEKGHRKTGFREVRRDTRGHWLDDCRLM